MYICTCIHIHICVYTYISSHICIHILKYPSEPGPITLHNHLSLSPLHTHIYILRPSSKPSSLSLAFNLFSLSLTHPSCTGLAADRVRRGISNCSCLPCLRNCRQRRCVSEFSICTVSHTQMSAPLSFTVTQHSKLSVFQVTCISVFTICGSSQMSAPQTFTVVRHS